jgi:hypothetical protein
MRQEEIVDTDKTVQSGFSQGHLRIYKGLNAIAQFLKKKQSLFQLLILKRAIQNFPN